VEEISGTRQMNSRTIDRTVIPFEARQTRALRHAATAGRGSILDYAPMNLNAMVDEPASGPGMRATRRRRRPTRVQRWLPTGILIACLVSVAAVLIIARPFANRGEDRVLNAATPASAPIAEKQSETVPAPESSDAPARKSVHFTVAPIQPGYAVVSGDSLFSIAQRFNTTVDALQSINNLSDRSTLSVGQKLIIP